MKNSHLIRLVLVCSIFLVTANTYAQEISSISVENGGVSVGGTVLITVNLDTANVQNQYCGMEVDFGDGDTDKIRVGTGSNDIPLKINHKYSASGKYVVRAKGIFIAKGLKSAGACSGKAKTLITILDQGNMMNNNNQGSVQVDSRDEQNINSYQNRQQPSNQHIKPETSNPTKQNSTQSTDML